MSVKIGVIGGGSWGATLADLLASNGHEVVLWEHFPKTVEALRMTRQHPVLPQLQLNPSVIVTEDVAQALYGREAVVSAVPSEHVRTTWRMIRERSSLPPRAWVVSVTKGIEKDTLKRMTEVIIDEIPGAAGRVGALSGPSHAEEVARKLATAVVAAGPGDLPGKIQSLFQTGDFRVYTSADVIGVELGGALKNIYAIACGIADGLDLGDNAKAALMTRGLNEMTRVGIASGADAFTFAGLSGLGDLIVTCTSKHSRNRGLGEKIGRGRSLSEALAEMTMVAEGVPTCRAARQLAERLGLEIPIVAEIHRLLNEGKPARDALKDLMTRPALGEMARVAQLLEKTK